MLGLRSVEVDKRERFTVSNPWHPLEERDIASESSWLQSHSEAHIDPTKLANQHEELIGDLHPYIWTGSGACD